MKYRLNILDNELRLRSISNTSKSITIQNNIGRFDELTHFFNIINGLFHQTAFTFGLNTYHLTSLLHLPEINFGLNMHIDQQNLEQFKIDWLKTLTFYSLINENHSHSVQNNNVQQENIPIGVIKFHTSNKDFMFSLNHRWTPSLTTTFRFRTIPQKTFWSHIEYRHPNETYELISEYKMRHLSNIQFSYLSCLWQRVNYQIDGGIDLKIDSKEKLADIGFRLKHTSDSMVFKCNLYHPLQHYLIGFQHCINTNFTVGLLAENNREYYRQQSIKLSLMSHWNLKKLGLHVNTLINSQHELGLALTQQTHHYSFALQIFSLYSWLTRKCKWGISLQLLV